MGKWSSFDVPKWTHWKKWHLESTKDLHPWINKEAFLNLGSWKGLFPLECESPLCTTSMCFPVEHINTGPYWWCQSLRWGKRRDGQSWEREAIESSEVWLGIKESRHGVCELLWTCVWGRKGEWKRLSLAPCFFFSPLPFLYEME